MPVALNQVEPTNADLKVDIQRLERKLDAFLEDHRKDHALLDARLGAHDTQAAIRDHRIAELATLEPTVQSLHDFEVQTKMIGASVRYITGGSVIAAVAAIVSLVLSIAHLSGGIR